MARGLALASVRQLSFPQAKLNLVERYRRLSEPQDETQPVGEKRAAILHVMRLRRRRSADSLHPPDTLQALRVRHVWTR